MSTAFPFGPHPAIPASLVDAIERSHAECEAANLAVGVAPTVGALRSAEAHRSEVRAFAARLDDAARRIANGEHVAPWWSE